MQARPTLLVVEDDAGIRRFLRTSLEAIGVHVIEATNGRRAAIDARTHKPDAAIVDLGLPDIDGVEVVRSIRQWSTMPVLVLSARAYEKAKLDAFAAGADDYVTKPFGIAELLARVRVALRHAVRRPDGATTLAFDDVDVDLERRLARRRDGTPVHLTPIEIRLLATLARHLGMVVTHRELLTEVWGPSHAGDTHYLRVYMKQLRDKLEPDPVQPCHLLTEVGIGYRLVVDDRAAAG
jgi:two-component system KDP operon response regulator KdpE